MGEQDDNAESQSERDYPWRAFGREVVAGEIRIVVKHQAPALAVRDAAFIAATRSALPELLDENERLQARVAELEASAKARSGAGGASTTGAGTGPVLAALAALAEVEWSNHDGTACPVCDHTRDGSDGWSPPGHSPSCTLGKALGR